ETQPGGTRVKARERSYWRGPHDGPWPSLNVGGQLERAEVEWLHTNGAGAYAMSTVALMHTRRNHGLLVAALKPPLDRYVVLSHAESTVKVAGRSYRLATHQFPDIAPTPGYRLLESLAMDPLPRWVCRLGKGAHARLRPAPRLCDASAPALGVPARQSHPRRHARAGAGAQRRGARVHPVRQNERRADRASADAAAPRRRVDARARRHDADGDA